MSDYHVPVLVSEVMDGLCIEKGKRYIDATVGGGGHAWEIIKRGGVLLGIDVDPEAVEHVREEFRIKNQELKITKQWKIVQGNFRDLGKLAVENGFASVSGILFDLGVSSHQLDEPERGFSYRFESSPFDLRLNQKVGVSAAEYLQTVTEGDLYEILATNGEEERAGAIAHALVGARRIKPLTTTGDVVLVVRSIAGVPPKELPGTLSKVFQALRIAINDEVQSLKQGLSQAHELLENHGRLAVISFHSLEDRVVKQSLKKAGWQLIVKKPVTASIEEIQTNRRSRSAKLRIAQRI